MISEEEIRNLELEIKKLKRENKRLKTEREGMAVMYAQSSKIQDHIQRQLVQAKDEADAANRAKGNFLANMSHEIRTPMNAITGMSEFIIRDSKDKVAVDNAIMINNAAKSLVTIINDILDYSKVLAGKMEIINDNCHLSSLINDVSAMIGIKVSERPVKLNVEVDEKLPNHLFADEVRIKQVLINILNNAAKFTKEGFITLKVEGNKINDDKVNLVVRVIDSGIGIKEENLSKIFNLFEQVDTKKNRMVEGTGLGLAICKQLIELMEGKMSIESIYGEGTTVTLEIPCQVVDWTEIGDINRAKSEIHNDGFKQFTVKNAKILVVDDNKINLKVAAGVLRPFGIVPETATSGPEAIEKVKENQYDMVFMDHMMPGMDGVEALGEIRKIPGKESLVVIALTANVISGIREEYISSGFQDFLAKPIDRNELALILKKFMPSDRLIKEGAINMALLFK